MLEVPNYAEVSGVKRLVSQTDNILDYICSLQSAPLTVTLQDPQSVMS